MRAVTIAATVMLTACGAAPEPPAPPAAPVPPTSLPPPVAVGDAVEGLRVATRVGCISCHGRDGGGRELWEDKGRYHLYSPNLTQRREFYDDDGLEALLRAGTTHDGHSIFGMPIVMFQHLSDREIRDITAWLRSLPAVTDHEKATTWMSPAVARQLGDGTFEEAIEWGAHSGVQAPEAPPSETLALGRHLAMTTCTECHGPTLDGWPDDSPPPLVVAKGYSMDNFMRLMRTGITASGKESNSGLMTEVGRDRASAMTDDEVRALKAYLDSR